MIKQDYATKDRQQLIHKPAPVQLPILDYVPAAYHLSGSTEHGYEAFRQRMEFYRQMVKQEAA